MKNFFKKNIIQKGNICIFCIYSTLKNYLHLSNLMSIFHVILLQKYKVKLDI